MPAGYAHIMVSDKALEEIKRNKLIESQLLGDLFLNFHYAQLGSLGPDYPYLALFEISSQKKWADHMHYDYTGDLIKTMAGMLGDRIEKGRNGPEFVIPFCWTLGFISHVTTDLVAHPVVERIVGPYEENAQHHRYCEMIQDAFIYSKVRNGAEIEHSGLLKVLAQSSDPDDDDKIHPVLREFWGRALATIYADDYAKGEPRIDEWHDEFEDWLGAASDLPAFIGKLLDRNHKFTYQRVAAISEEDRRKYLDNVPLPDGNYGRYEPDIFQKAVRHVTDQWVSISSGLLGRNLDQFLSGMKNCNLDTGIDLGSGKLLYWEGKP